jgi:hypothetical protein
MRSMMGRRYRGEYETKVMEADIELMVIDEK